MATATLISSACEKAAELDRGDFVCESADCNPIDAGPNVFSGDGPTVGLSCDPSFDVDFGPSVLTDAVPDKNLISRRDVPCTVTAETLRITETSWFHDDGIADGVFDVSLRVGGEAAPLPLSLSNGDSVTFSFLFVPVADVETTWTLEVSTDELEAAIEFTASGIGIGPLTCAESDPDCDGVEGLLDCDENSAALGAREFDADCDAARRFEDCDDNNPVAADLTGDADCDGAPIGADCNDESALLGARTQDADCDGRVTEVDCDDDDNTSTGTEEDADCDGVVTAEDCDDSNAAVWTFDGTTCATHAVGGTVAGLVGSVTLQNNGADAIVLTEDGAFIFPTALTPGATYAVTVSAQPTSPAQTCSVADGSGTLGQTPVTNVSVVCADDAYAIGGSVTGLAAGNTLRLDNNGDTLDRTTDGVFAFEVPVAEGAAYDVGVVSVAGVTPQVCVVAEGAGTATGVVSTISVTCTNIYVVSGSVSGLLGDQVTIKLNGADALTLTENGTFNFAPISDGSPYAVSVSNQPAAPLQTCLVTAGDGTLSGAAVSDVVITCVTTQFEIQVTVTGLAPENSVQLQNNGTDTLTVLANGAASFAMPIDDRSAYLVEVSQPPVTPSQTCEVSGETGTVLSADVTDIAIDCTVATFQVTTTVTGLEGTGLEVRFNGGDAQSISTGDPFTLSSALLDESAYTLEITQQPTAPAQSCVVDDGDGTLAGAAVDLAITCTTVPRTILVEVSGLEGDEFQLWNNDEEALGITVDGIFAFTTTIPDGGVFDVTIGGQPITPSQVCTLDADTKSGVAGAETPTIDITCATVQRTIGGTISGLVGDEFTLSLNEGEGEFFENGAFEFSTTIDDGSNYSVLIGSAPISPSQSCVLDGESGTATADVTDITITCTINPFDDLRLFVTDTTVDGAIGGVEVADAVCAAAAAAQLSNTEDSEFRAVLVDGMGRQSTDYENWVFHPETRYLRWDETEIGTTNTDGVFVADFTNSITEDATSYWTGAESTWSFGDSCNTYTSNDGLMGAGIIGDGDAVNSDAWSSATSTCDQSHALLCVEQTYFPRPTGDITVSVASETSLEVAFPTADDVDSELNDDSENLVFSVVYSLSDNIDSVQDATDNGNGTIYAAYNSEGVTLGSLTTNAVYYLTVLVRDADGNVSSYNTATGTPKRLAIFVSATETDGDFGSISAADDICNADMDRPNTNVSYKAMVVDGAARIKALDWVLQPNTTYYRSDLFTEIGTTDVDAEFTFDLTNSVLGFGADPWTGLTDTYAVDLTCSGWASTDGNGTVGCADCVDSGAFSYAQWACSDPRPFYCVEQP